MSDRRRYDRQLTVTEIENGVHREFIGEGIWDTGHLFVEFLKKQGLLPHHRVLDIGCGALRVGLPLLDYVSEANYFGVDGNRSLLDAGKYEAGEVGREPAALNLKEDSEFGLESFGQRFDYAFAMSVFTHLPEREVLRCLEKLAPLLDGPFYATFFKAAEAAAPRPVTRQRPRRVEVGLEPTFQTYADADPYHYSIKALQALASRVGLEAVEIDLDQSDPVVFLHDQSVMVFR